MMMSEQSLCAKGFESKISFQVCRLLEELKGKCIIVWHVVSKFNKSRSKFSVVSLSHPSLGLFIAMNACLLTVYKLFVRSSLGFVMICR